MESERITRKCVHSCTYNLAWEDSHCLPACMVAGAAVRVHPSTACHRLRDREGAPQATTTAVAHVNLITLHAQLLVWGTREA